MIKADPSAKEVIGHTTPGEQIDIAFICQCGATRVEQYVLDILSIHNEPRAVVQSFVSRWNRQCADCGATTETITFNSHVKPREEKTYDHY
jgi:hypothetical protein